MSVFGFPFFFFFVQLKRRKVWLSSRYSYLAGVGRRRSARQQWFAAWRTKPNHNNLGGNWGEEEWVALPWQQNPTCICGEMPFGDRFEKFLKVDKTSSCHSPFGWMQLDKYIWFHTHTTIICSSTSKIWQPTLPPHRIRRNHNISQLKQCAESCCPRLCPYPNFLESSFFYRVQYALSLCPSLCIRKPFPAPSQLHPQ